MNQADSGTHLNLRLDYRILCGALLVIIVAMLALWKPWHAAPSTKDRTVTVTGQASLHAAPNEFVFSPMYQFKNSDKQAAVQELTAKSSSIVAGLKKLGVAASKIQTNANSWAYPSYDNTDNTATYTLNLTVTVTDNDALVQKVEDYLVGSSPTGALTPSASFSTEKQKALQANARNKAIQDAKAKAGQSASNLGFALGAVKSVDDSNGFGGGIYPMTAKTTTLDAIGGSVDSSLAVQPGENTLNYSVTVAYYIR